MNVVANDATSIRLECERCGSQKKFDWPTYDLMREREWFLCPTCGAGSAIAPTAETNLLIRADVWPRCMPAVGP